VRIVHACAWYYPDSLGGTEAYVADLSARLAAGGHTVFIAAPDASGAKPRSYVHEGIPVFRYPIPAHATRAEAQSEVRARGAEHFHRWLADVRPDVLHLHTFSTGLSLHEVAAGLDLGARVIVTTHAASLGFLCQRGTMMRWGTRVCDARVTPAKCAACALQHRGVPRPLADAFALVPPVIGRVGRHLPGKLGTVVSMTDLVARNTRRQRDMLSRVHRFVVLSQWARDAVIANGAPPDRVAVNRLGARCGASASADWRAAAKPPRTPITIAYVGRFDRIKGVLDFARAAASLAPDLPVRVQFRGPVATLQDLAVADEVKRIVGTQRWVEFADSVPPGRVFDVMRDIDVLCCPSRVVEGGPTVALEAIAAGTPVIGTRVPALTEIITDGVNGRLVNPGDWRGLARAIAEIAANPAPILERWRAALPPVRTMDDVAAEYLKDYVA
jgi:glycosyltransferase involved in cell wall biosynthesis